MGKSLLLLAVGALVGVLAMWLWMKPPSERLALKIFEKGDKLFIAWEGVPSAEVGNLEITDGDEQISTTLPEGPLIHGMTMPYKLKSKILNVQVEALRRGKGPLVESASFVVHDRSGQSASPRPGPMIVAEPVKSADNPADLKH